MYTLGVTATAQPRLFALHLGNGSTTNATTVQGNIVRNITINTAFITNGSSAFIGLHIGGGMVTTGTGNTIGSTTTAGSIVINSTGSTIGALVVGINSASSSTVNVQNNTIAGIDVKATYYGFSAFFNLYPISLSGAGSPLNVTSNIIGSASVENSINLMCGDTTATYNIRGINASSGVTAAQVNIQNNIIQNTRLTAPTNTGGIVTGMYINPPNNTTVYTVSGNTIRNISTTSNRNGNATTNTGLCGILVLNTNGTVPTTIQTITGNTIHSLVNTSTSALTGLSTPPYVSGIIFTASNSPSTKSVCSNNIIHSLQINSTGNIAPIVNGIYTNNVALDIFNNSIRLGIDKDGNSLTNSGHDYRGIFKNTSQPVSAYNNTIYIGGSGVGTTATNTAAFFRGNSNASDDFRNNIFINKRNNASTGGKHYAIRLNNTTVANCNYNLYYADGTGGILGTADAGTTDRIDLTAWQTAMTGDLNSIQTDATFSNATGNASSVNLTPTLAGYFPGTSGLFSTTDIN
ncbi:MAG: beta strand repeat-containing protein, partial [Dolichospermum sp.]